VISRDTILGAEERDGHHRQKRTVE
jgi:hypothetical protein